MQLSFNERREATTLVSIFCIIRSYGGREMIVNLIKCLTSCQIGMHSNFLLVMLPWFNFETGPARHPFLLVPQDDEQVSQHLPMEDPAMASP